MCFNYWNWILHHKNSVKDYEAINLSTVKNSREFKIHVCISYVSVLLKYASTQFSISLFELEK